MQVAQTIREQLGPAFDAMTGARNFVGSHRCLQFTIGRGAHDGINRVRIELAPSDTYTLTFYRVRALKFTVVATVYGVYADQLRATFTAATGMETSL